jgi:hypothetical protein
MVVVADNLKVTSLKAKYEYLPSWVRSVHTTLKLKKYMGNCLPQGSNAGNRAQEPKNVGYR